MDTAIARAGRPPLREDLRIAAIIGIAGALSTALLFPYLLQLMPEVMARIRLPLALVIPLQAAQAAVVFTLLAFIGLRTGHRAGLDAPWLRAWQGRRPLPAFPWRLAIATGVVAALAVIALALLLDPMLPPRLNPHAVAPGASALAGFLASFYGGIAEELQLRLFLMTVLLWLWAWLRGRAPGPAAYWCVLLAAALLFGAGHLPAAAKVWPMDAFVALRTVALNAVAGAAFGWLYWRRGFEVAVLAHFSADIVLHVAAPLLGGTLA